MIALQWKEDIASQNNSTGALQDLDIYIVDDDKAYGKSLVRLLKSVGYSVESFLSAQGFLDVVPVADKAGVLILDLRMPGMSGFDLQKRMNELCAFILQKPVDPFTPKNIPQDYRLIC